MSRSAKLFALIKGWIMGIWAMLIGREDLMAMVDKEYAALQHRAALHYLRVNVKSLAHESRIIRQEERRTRDRFARNGLAQHRRLRVRLEARAAQLALAAVRGVPYLRVEPKTRTTPDWERVREKALRHLTRDSDPWRAVVEWIQEARVAASGA